MNQDKKLTAQQHHILREGGTEMPGTGKYLHHKEQGKYHCAGCGNQLFESQTKLDDVHNPPGLKGWPSFDDAIPGSVEFKQDNSHGMQRIEIVCAKCKGHLGHVFDDPKEKTGKHYCVNSCALEFEKK